MVRQLFLKELRIQQSGIYFALAIVLIAAILAGLATQADWTVNPNQPSLAAVIGALYSGLVVPAMAFVVPIFFGAAMIAEERRLGMWDWQLAVPVARHWQVLIKLAFAAGLVFMTTFILQPIMWAMMMAVVPNSQHEMWLMNRLFGFAPIFPAGVFIMICSAYASSMLSDSYKAFWLGIVLTAVFIYVPPVIFINVTRQGFHYWRYTFEPGFVLRYMSSPGLAVVYLFVAAQLIFNIHYHYRYESMRWGRIAVDVAGSLLVIMVVMLFVAGAFFIGINLSR